MYRDELEQAKKRIGALDAQLAEQRQELAALRAQMEKRAPSPRRGRRNGRLAVVLGVLVTSTLAAWFVLRGSRSDSGASEAATPAASLRRAARGEGWKRRPLDSGLRLEMPDAGRIADLQRRCLRQAARPSLKGLPDGTRLIDFETCFGCDCCGAEGPFGNFRQAGECMACSRTATLEQAGVTVVGGSEDNPLQGWNGLVFHLAQPSPVFAVHFSYTWEPDRLVAVIGYDPNGRPIDGSHLAFPSRRGDDARARRDRPRDVLLLEGCDGERIGRVDFFQSDHAVTVEAIAL